MTVAPSDDVVARGRRAIVRRKRAGDAQDEYRWRSDQDLAQFDASRPVQAPYESYERNWTFDFRFTDISKRSFAIEDEQGRHIGNVMYYNIDAVRGEAEIGISIGEPRCWSQGYGSDALEAVVRGTLDWNARAQRAFRKVGFEISGTSWRDGHTFIVMEVWRESLGQPKVSTERPRVAV